jgi:hypothetical protein
MSWFNRDKLRFGPIRLELSENQTARRISIDWTDGHEKASDSIRGNRGFDSNEIEESDSHSRKHDNPRISTFRGIVIDPCDEDENAFDSIRLNREFDFNIPRNSNPFKWWIRKWTKKILCPALRCLTDRILMRSHVAEPIAWRDFWALSAGISSEIKNHKEVMNFQTNPEFRGFLKSLSISLSWWLCVKPPVILLSR